MPAAAREVARIAVGANLREVPGHRLPAADLALIVGMAPAHVITAVPLEPSARIVGMDPALLAPVRERLRCVDEEKVQLWTVRLVAKPVALEPRFRELRSAVRHVPSAEHAEPEEFAGPELRMKITMEILPGFFEAKIAVAALHEVVDEHFLWFHMKESTAQSGR